tara:strand:- start:6594 stop:10598 length:4005 start_codon:yes stop_codon:yes gene_type:complete
MSKPENPNDILNDMMLTSQAKTRIAESEIDDTMKATVKKKLAKKGIKEPRKSSSWLEAITGKEDRVENRAFTARETSLCNNWKRDCNYSSEEDFACPHYNTKCAGNGSYPAAQVGRSDHRRGTPKGNAALADVPLFAGVTSNAAATPPAAAAPTPEAPASTAKKTAAERVALGLASAGVCRGWEYKCESSDDEDACMNFNARCADQYADRKLGEWGPPAWWAVRTAADIAAADAKYRGVAAAVQTQMSAVLARANSDAAEEATFDAKPLEERCAHWAVSCEGVNGESSDSDDCYSYAQECANTAVAAERATAAAAALALWELPAPAGYTMDKTVFLSGCIAGDDCAEYTLATAAIACNAQGAACGGIITTPDGKAQIKSGAPQDKTGQRYDVLAYINNSRRPPPAAPLHYTMQGDAYANGFCSAPHIQAPSYMTPESAFYTCSNDPACRYISIDSNPGVAEGVGKYWTLLASGTCVESSDASQQHYTTFKKDDDHPSLRAGTGGNDWRCAPTVAGVNSMDIGTEPPEAFRCGSNLTCVGFENGLNWGACKSSATGGGGVSISAAAEAARTWSARRVALALERAGMTCTKSAAQKDTDKVEPNSNMSEAAKMARYEMFEDMKNPILRNVVMNPSGTDIVGGEALGPTSANQSGIGWLRIPTSSVNQLEGSWSASDGINTDPVDHESPDSFITLLIARKYTADESKNIFQVLDQGANRTPAPKLSDGRGFIFTKEGHIKLWHKDDGTAKPTMYNPFINRAASSGSSDAVGDTTVDDRLAMTSKTDNSYTMAGTNEEQGVQKYSTWARGRQGPLFAMSTKVVMNKTLNYILYTPDPVPSETSIYYLLYNPIHGQEFKKFYQSLLQSDDPRGGGGAPEEVTVPSISYPQYSTDVRVYDKHKCLKSINTPAYTKIIGKYCNAFKVDGQVTRGSTLNHYADPLCQIMMSAMGSSFYYALQSNVTNESLRTKYYKNRDTDTFREGYLQYLTAKATFTGGTSEFSKMTWACPDHNVTGTDPNIITYMTDVKLYNGTNPSFVQILGHSLVNSNQQWRHATESMVQSIGRRSAEQDSTLAAMETPACIIPSISITSCKTTIDVEGNMINSNVVQQNVCGPQPASAQDPDEDGTEDCTPGASNCPPQPHACETATGSTEVTDSMSRTRYTKCCYGDNAAALMIDCPVDDDGATLVQSTYGAKNPAAPPSRDVIKAQHAGTISGAVEKLSKAAKVADASTTAYPTDPLITTDAEEVLADVTAAKLVASALTLRVNGIVASTAQADITTLGTDIDTLVNDATAIDKLSKGLTRLIAENYMFGQKKMYLIGGAVGLVVLIILIILLKK